MHRSEVIGGDHISSLIEKDRFRSMQEVYKETSFDLRCL